MALSIQPARTKDDLIAIRNLFTAYVEWLDIDLTFQSFTSELEGLPGKYSPEQGGELFLAKRVHSSQPVQNPPSVPSAHENEGENGSDTEDADSFVGCVAIRHLSIPNTAGDEDTKPLKVCELKRLYVSPSARGLGAGKALLSAAVESAKALGYDEMRLDSLPRMTAARALYRDIGFVVCEQYYETPLEETVFMKLSLN